MVAGTALRAQVTYAELQNQAHARHLMIAGGFHPEPDDNVPVPCQTLLLLSPFEPSFWPAFTGSEEWRNKIADPMDAWSTRTIGAWAADIGATPLFPFGGPPFLPFISWATRTGRVHASPIMLLVHDTAGLFISFRGALALPQRIDLPPAPQNPCLTCADQPCRTACPVGALDGAGYDVPTCKSYLETAQGQDCMSNGCCARRICPVSQQYPRLSNQSAYHMAEFKG